MRFETWVTKKVMGHRVHTFSGADHFHLFIDRLMHRKGLPGNISRIHLHLTPSTDLALLHDALLKSPTLGRVKQLRIRHHWPLVPCWVLSEEDATAVFLHHSMEKDVFESRLLNLPLTSTGAPVRIDLCGFADGSKHMVIAMHHSLLDHKGMVLFARLLATGADAVEFFMQHARHGIWQETRQALKGMFDALGSGGWRLATLPSSRVQPTSAAIFAHVQLTLAETEQVAHNALKSGSRFGKSSFYLAVTMVALRELMEQRVQRVRYFWVPVPHDMRRKGAEGHLVGNDLAFFFFKVRHADLNSVKDAVAAIEKQMREQVRKGALGHQVALQRVFRSVPFWMMKAMVSLTTGGRVSSFAFSDLGDQRDEIRSFLGNEVVATSHYPPVPLPPGLSIVFGSYREGVRVILGYAPESVSVMEMEMLSARIRQLLVSA
jgi:hypothetical protein